MKRKLAKQIETALVNIHSHGFSTMSKSEIKRYSVDQLTAALVHIKEAQYILKIDK